MGAEGTPSPQARTPAVKQYQVRWAQLPPPVGRRPVLLLSRTAAYQYLNKVLVGEVTTTVRGIPQEVSLGPADGFPHPCVVNLDNIHVIPKAALRDLVGSIPQARETEVKRALGYVLGWPELMIL
jgi:mRNA interferase MazF